MKKEEVYKIEQEIKKLKQKLEKVKAKNETKLTPEQRKQLVKSRTAARHFFAASYLAKGEKCSITKSYVKKAFNLTDENIDNLLKNDRDEMCKNSLKWIKTSCYKEVKNKTISEKFKSLQDYCVDRSPPYVPLYALNGKKNDKLCPATLDQFLKHLIGYEDRKRVHKDFLEIHKIFGIVDKVEPVVKSRRWDI